MERKAWHCPACNAYHAPHCDTCPVPTRYGLPGAPGPAVVPSCWPPEPVTVVCDPALPPYTAIGVGAGTTIKTVAAGIDTRRFPH